MSYACKVSSAYRRFQSVNVRPSSTIRLSRIEDYSLYHHQIAEVEPFKEGVGEQSVHFFQIFAIRSRRPNLPVLPLSTYHVRHRRSLMLTILNLCSPSINIISISFQSNSGAESLLNSTPSSKLKPEPRLSFFLNTSLRNLPSSRGHLLATLSIKIPLRILGIWSGLLWLLETHPSETSLIIRSTLLFQRTTNLLTRWLEFNLNRQNSSRSLLNLSGSW